MEIVDDLCSVDGKVYPAVADMYIRLHSVTFC